MIHLSIFLVAASIMQGCKHSNESNQADLTSKTEDVQFREAKWFYFGESIRPPLPSVDDVAGGMNQSFLDLWEGNTRFANCYWDPQHAKFAYFEPSRALSTSAKFVENPTHWRVINKPIPQKSKKLWKPISSAPLQEGVAVDVWVNNKRMTDVKWHAEQKQWQQRVKTSPLKYEIAKIEGDPSHWMPIEGP